MKYAAVLVLAPASPARGLLVATLQSRGYSVAVAGDADEALRLARLEPPDLLIHGAGGPVPRLGVPIVVSPALAVAPSAADDRIVDMLMDDVERRAPPPLA